MFSIQVLIILPSAPKLTATTNNENTHQQFIFRSLQSVSSSNPEIADKVIVFKKHRRFGFMTLLQCEKKPEICYRQFFTDRDWAVQSHAVNNCTSCLPTANVLFKLVLLLSKNCGRSQKHFQSWIINWAHKYLWLVDKCIVIDIKNLCERFRQPLSKARTTSLAAQWGTILVLWACS